MKYKIILLAFSILALSASAVNARSRAVRTDKDEPNSTCLIQFKSDVPSNWKVKAVAGSFAVVEAPVSEIEQAVAANEVLSMSLPRRLWPQNNIARQIVNVDRIREDKNLPYTGAGVVAGIFDVGIDPSHIQFRASDGTCRIKQVLYFPDNSGEYQLFDTPEAIAEFGTDDVEETHGTHVLGTMAGFYDGPASLAAEGQPGGIAGFSPYSGMAPDAELIVACGKLYDTNMCVAAEYIANYALEQNKPCVINFSIGSVLGPRDATDMVGSFMAALPGEAVAVLSAGNDGETGVTFSLDYTQDTLGGAYFRHWQPENPLEFAADFWLNDDRNGGASFVIVDAATGKVLVDIPYDENAAENGVMTIDFDAIPELAAYYSGQVQFAYSANMDTDRRTEYWLQCALKANQLNNAQMRYAPGLHIHCLEGQRLDAAFEGSQVYMRELLPSGWYDVPNCKMSISSLCCNPGVVSVGSMTSRQQWPVISGEMDSFGTPQSYPVGAISAYSSFGHTVDGFNYPHTAAPGTAVMSGYSHYYVDTTGDSQVVAFTPAGGAEQYYWGSYSGTSMATPVVAGSIALWRQANPYLTRSQICEIVASSSTPQVSDNVDDRLRWGSGLFNALEGLHQAIALGSVISAPNDMQPLMTVNKDYILLSGIESDVKIYDVSGIEVLSQNVAGNTARIALDRLPAGIYILVAGKFTAKFVH